MSIKLFIILFKSVLKPIQWPLPGEPYCEFCQLRKTEKMEVLRENLSFLAEPEAIEEKAETKAEFHFRKLIEIYHYRDLDSHLSESSDNLDNLENFSTQLIIGNYA